MSVFADVAVRVFERAIAMNNRNIAELLERSPEHTLLDLGCDDGAQTMRYAAAIGTDDIHGVEIVGDRAAIAQQRGIAVNAADLNGALPYDDASMDVVSSNQVIEHLADTDSFVAEIFRVLKPGGYAVTSTENLAAWHNVGSLVLGWQPFSLTNVSGRRLGLGNPLAPHRHDSWMYPESWQHRRVFAHRGLIELFEAHGFLVERVLGAGYYPLPRRLARFDSRHASFLALKARRPHERLAGRGRS